MTLGVKPTFSRTSGNYRPRSNAIRPSEPRRRITTPWAQARLGAQCRRSASHFPSPPPQKAKDPAGVGGQGLRGRVETRHAGSCRLLAGCLEPDTHDTTADRVESSAAVSFHDPPESVMLPVLDLDPML